MKKLYFHLLFNKVLISVFFAVTSSVCFAQAACAGTSSTWTGTLSSDWMIAANWSANRVPDATTDVTIPVKSNQPTVPLLTASVNNLTIQAGASLTVFSELQIAGVLTNSGTLTASNGTITLNGTAAQIIPANLLSGNVVQNLTISNSSGVTLAGPLDITGDLTIIAGSLTTGGFITLKSTATSTARVAEITSAAATPIIGNVTVERYLPGKRAYRFLTSPVNTVQSIRSNWMENTYNTTFSINNNPFAGYGTHITGVGGGGNRFDATSTNNTSLFTFNNQTQAWIAVPNTDSTLKAGTAYRILVRGSRGVDLTNNDAPASETTLRAKGTLVTGTVVMAKPGAAATAGVPQLSTTMNGYSLVGNPYASPVDWKKVKKNSISKTLYYFDPTIRGSNQRGGYVSYNELYDSVSNFASKVNNFIQPGQAFFVQTNGSNPTITFDEADKTTTHTLVFKSSNIIPSLSVQLLLPGQTSATDAADGLSAYFSDEFTASIGDEDSYKFVNQDENIAIVRNGQTLSIEGRKTVSATDTVQLKIWQLTQKSYTLKINLSNFLKTTSCYLEDSYLHTSTAINNSSANFVTFNVTSDAASLASDRFKIVMRNMSTLPVKLTSIKAYEKSKGVQVEWTAESESNIDLYEVERSADGNEFKMIESAKPKNNAATSTVYTYFDALPFSKSIYYRIQSIDKSGEIKYTEVVKVQKQSSANNITTTATSGSLIVHFNNAQKGNYVVGIINVTGQKVYETAVSYTGGAANSTINIPNPIASGIYTVQLSNANVVQSTPVMF